jgi:hypothetical protein
VSPGVAASARLNDTEVSTTSPADLKVEFLDGSEPRVTFGFGIQNNPSVSIYVLTDYAFLETRTVEVDVIPQIMASGANVTLAGESRTSGRIKLELGSQGKVTGTLLGTEDRLTFEASASVSCAVPDHLLPESETPAPVPTSPNAGQVLVYDQTFASAECQAARDLLAL